MYTTFLVLHVLGWAQWMGAQTSLAGLLRRDPLFEGDLGAVLGPQLKSLWVTAWVGVGLALVGAFGMLALNPAFFRQGWVHAKLTLAIGLIVVLAVPLRRAYKALPVGGASLKGLWFGLSLAGFVGLIVLGLVKPF